MTAILLLAAGRVGLSLLLAFLNPASVVVLLVCGVLCTLMLVTWPSTGPAGPKSFVVEYDTPAGVRVSVVGTTWEVGLLRIHGVLRGVSEVPRA